MERSVSVAMELSKSHNENSEARASMWEYISSVQRGTRYPVYWGIPEILQKKLERAESSEQMKIWADTVRAVPQYTSYLQKLSGEYIKNARNIWKSNVSGNADILQVILRHAVEYGKTGKTSPILLAGPPGIGKTLIAKTYSEILGLPCNFIFGPSAAMNRGLAGSPNMYIGSSAGAIVQAMITTGTGNPVICIDEIDKASGGHTGMPNFQNELLSALDDSREHWHDNYVELDVDISHVPFVFTANDVHAISAPLLDRMEVVELQPPTREMLHEIAEKHMLPKVMEIYHHNDLKLEGNVISALVDQLWDAGNRSCRPYRNAIDLLISDGYLEMLESNRPVTITVQDARVAARCFTKNSNCRPMGFLTA